MRVLRTKATIGDVKESFDAEAKRADMGKLDIKIIASEYRQEGVFYRYAVPADEPTLKALLKALNKHKISFELF